MRTCRGCRQHGVNCCMLGYAVASRDAPAPHHSGQSRPEQYPVEDCNSELSRVDYQWEKLARYEIPRLGNYLYGGIR
jgi:hypothetical protein